MAGRSEFQREFTSGKKVEAESLEILHETWQVDQMGVYSLYLFQDP
jgi:hypothetical protein